MLSRRIATVRPLRAAFPVARRPVPAVPFSQQRYLQAAHAEAQTEVEAVYPSLVSGILCFASHMMDIVE